MNKALFYIVLFFPTIIIAKNAGILPYAYKDGKAYFLFGLENRTWDKGRWTQKAWSKWVWAQFAGCCDRADTAEARKYKTDTATFCAARETTEESRYVFGNKLPLRSRLNKHSREYSNSIRYWINHVTKRFFKDEQYEHFYAKVDYIDAHSLNSAPRVPSYEKQEYRWVKVTDVVKALKNPDKDGFIRLPFEHKHTNKIFPPFTGTLRRSQRFITDTILAGETARTAPVARPRRRQRPVPASQRPRDIQTLASDLQQLQQQLDALMQQLQAAQ